MSDVIPAETVNDEPIAYASSSEMSKGEAIFLVSFFGAIGAGVIAMVVASIKAEQREIEAAEQREAERKQRKEDLANWINDQENAGNKIYKLADGRYLTVAGDAEQSTHIKKI